MTDAITYAQERRTAEDGVAVVVPPGSSPSVTIVPPGVIHTTQAVGAAYHPFVHVFAPPPVDLCAEGPGTGSTAP